MSETDSNPCVCPLSGIIDVIAKKWSLLVINVIANHGLLRFNGLMQELRGISPSTLTQALKNLQSAGLITREFFNEIPPRVEYSLTSDGKELRNAIIPLLQWAMARTDGSFATCRD